MNLQEIKQNQTKKILQFSIPAIIAMVLTALITVVDGFFMGNYVGEEGIAAVNLGVPIVYLYLGVGLMVSIGGVAIAGMALGSGDKESCNQVSPDDCHHCHTFHIDKLYHGVLLSTLAFNTSCTRAVDRTF